MTIKVYKKAVYGTERYFFASIEDENYWLNLTGRKTVTEADMRNLEQLTGVQFEETFHK